MLITYESYSHWNFLCAEIGNGQLCARAAGVRRTFLARTGLRRPTCDVSRFTARGLQLVTRMTKEMGRGPRTGP